MQDDVNRRTLHVGNVPSGVDRSALLTLFQPYGTIEEMRVAGVADHNTRYWEAKEALRLDGTQLKEAKMRVSFAKSPRTKQSSTKAALALAPHLDPDLKKLPAMRMSRATDREKIARTVFIEGIEVEYTALEIAKFFSYCGTVCSVRRSPVKNNPLKNRVWVEFKTPAEASRAIACNGQYFDQYLLALQQSETAICTNELLEPVRYVYESGIYHEIRKRSICKALGIE